MSDARRSMSRPTEISKLVGTVLERAGLADGLERAVASQEWPDRVGRAIAAVTRVRSVSGSTVFVDVRSSAWLQELTFVKGEILEKMNEGRTHHRFERIVFLLAEDTLEGGEVESDNESETAPERE